MNKSPVYKLTPLDNIAPTALRMASLIDQDRRVWKSDIVCEIFTTANTSIITSIHLSIQQIPDKLIWLNSMAGGFIVKSTYFLTKQVLGKEVLDANQRHNVWRFIWKAKVIPKVKYFA